MTGHPTHGAPDTLLVKLCNQAYQSCPGPKGCDRQGSLLLQDLYKSCARGGGEEGGRVLWDATSRGLCGRVGPPRTNVRAAWANCERAWSR